MFNDDDCREMAPLITVTWSDVRDAWDQYMALSRASAYAFMRVWRAIGTPDFATCDEYHALAVTRALTACQTHSWTLARWCEQNPV